METDQHGATGINTTDPVEDPRFPRIREYQPNEDDVRWPDGRPVDTVNRAASRLAGIEEMLATAAVASGWGSGWPACTPSRTDLVTVEVNDANGRVVARFPIRRRLARLLDLILDHCARRGYVFVANQCGAYNCRAIAGTKTTSNHARATAIDINWGLNPHKRPLTTNIPRWMVDLLERYLWNWGGWWSTPDAMHFEFGGTPTDADAQTERASRELGGYGLARPVLRRGSTGEPVREVQVMLGVPVTGVFDDPTDDAVRAFQRANGLDPDGEVGPKTWAKLDEERNEMNPDQDRKLNDLSGQTRPLEYGHHHGNSEDNQYGHVLSIRKEMHARLDRIETALAALKRP